MSVFEPVSQFAASINTLFGIVLIIAAGVFLVVVGMLTFFAIRYRGRPGEPDPEPTFGNRKAEVIWIAGPNVHCICEQHALHQVKQMLWQTNGVMDVIASGVGGPACVVAQPIAEQGIPQSAPHNGAHNATSVDVRQGTGA